MSDPITISRQTALEALAQLSNADAVIRAKNHTVNPIRAEIIKKMEDELGVDVRTTRIGDKA